MLSVLHYALCVSSLLDHITTPQVLDLLLVHSEQQGHAFYWSKHKHLEINDVISVKLEHQLYVGNGDWALGIENCDPAACQGQLYVCK